MKPKFEIGKFVKLKGIIGGTFYEIENVFKFKESIHYDLKNYLYPYPETKFESLTRNEKLEIVVKDNCEMIDVLIETVTEIIKKDRAKDKSKKDELKDKYWEGYDEGKESSLNHNIVLLNAQLKSHKEFRK